MYYAKNEQYLIIFRKISFSQSLILRWNLLFERSATLRYTAFERYQLLFPSSFLAWQKSALLREKDDAVNSTFIREDTGKEKHHWFRSRGGSSRLTVDTDREKRAQVEWPVVNSRANGTFHGRFWVGLTAVNLARINLNRASVRDSHLSAINPFAHRSSWSMVSLFAFAVTIVLRVFFSFCFFTRRRDYSTHVYSIAVEKERSVVEHLRNASIFATENHNCEEIHRARIKFQWLLWAKRNAVWNTRPTPSFKIIFHARLSSCLDL